MESALILSIIFMFVISMAALALAFFQPQKVITGIRGLLMPGAVQDDSLRKLLVQEGILKDKGELIEELPDFDHPSALRGLEVPFVNEELLQEQAEEESELLAEVEAQEAIRLTQEYGRDDSQEYAEFLDKTTEIA